MVRNSGRPLFGRTKPVILLSGLVMVALGIAVLLNPIAAVESLVRIVGWIFIVYGAITLISAILKGDPVHNSPAELVISVLTIIPGLIMVIIPNQLVSFVWTVLGIIVFVTGVLDVIEAGEFRRIGSPLAVPATVSGVITVILGLVTIFMPMFSLAIGMLIAAVALFVDGITEIIFGLGI